MKDEVKLVEIRRHYKQEYCNNWHSTKRQRFGFDQSAILLLYFEESPDWNIIKKIEIAQKIGLNIQQVKKWNYDEKKRRSMPYSAKVRRT